MMMKWWTQRKLDSDPCITQYMASFIDDKQNTISCSTAGS